MVDKPWVRHYPADVPETWEPRYRTVVDLWEAAVQRQSHAPAIHYFDRTMTYAECDQAADALAVRMRQGGLSAGDRVGIFVQNDPDWPIALIATWKCSAIAVALSPMMREKELAYQLNDAGVHTLVAAAVAMDEIVAPALAVSDVHDVIIASARAWVKDGVAWQLPDDEWARSGPWGGTSIAELSTADQVTGTGPNFRTDAAGSYRHGVVHPEDVAILTYTSGTTGPPKGAMLTQAGIAHNAEAFARWYALDTGDAVLGIAPLFHVTGLVGHMALSWFTGSALVLLHRFHPQTVLQAIETHRPAFTVAAITAYISMLSEPGIERRDLSSLRYVASGGAAVPAAVVDDFARLTGLTITPVYGLTETTSPSHAAPRGVRAPIDPKSGTMSVGLPLPNSMCEIVDPSTGLPVGVGETGEIVISGPMVVPGYWRKPDETKASMPDGRLHTGDIGMLDDEGWCYVIDRKKDLINASGFKVWPREVEEVLHEHPAVREAAVVGIPDGYRGETVKAFVTTAPGVSLTEDELIAWSRERMAAYKYPRSVEIVSELPKTASGKVLRRSLRDGASKHETRSGGRHDGR